MAEKQKGRGEKVTRLRELKGNSLQPMTYCVTFSSKKRRSWRRKKQVAIVFRILPCASCCTVQLQHRSQPLGQLTDVAMPPPPLAFVFIVFNQLHLVPSMMQRKYKFCMRSLAFRSVYFQQRCNFSQVWSASIFLAKVVDWFVFLGKKGQHGCSYCPIPMKN